MGSKFYLILHNELNIDELEEVVEGTNLPIYTCFRKASRLLKKINDSRFKIYDNRDKAEAYAKYFYKLNHNDLKNKLFDDINVDKEESYEETPKSSSVPDDFYPEIISPSIDAINKVPVTNKLDLSQEFDKKNALLVGEKPLPYKNPTPSQLIQLRNFINAGNVKGTYNLCTSNPRLLISNGDTPVILQEGARYHALHICARKAGDKLVGVCASILELLDTDSFYLKLYPEDGSTSLARRKKFLSDLYLNNPDKMLYETPLHMACKFGNLAVVKLLVSHPLIDKSCVNSEGKTCRQVICDRYDEGDRMETISLIQQYLEDQYYVPVIRDLTTASSRHFGPGGVTIPTKSPDHRYKASPAPVIGRPFVWNSPTPKKFTFGSNNSGILGTHGSGYKGGRTDERNRQTNSLCPRQAYEIVGAAGDFLEDSNSKNSKLRASYSSCLTSTGKIDALAGPMPLSRANEFYQMWDLARKRGLEHTLLRNESSHNISVNGDAQSTSINAALRTPSDVARKDPEKGLEILGRQLASSLNVPWAERWDFLSHFGAHGLDSRPHLRQKEIYCFEGCSMYLPTAADDGTEEYFSPPLNYSVGNSLANPYASSLPVLSTYGGDFVENKDFGQRLVPSLPDYLSFENLSSPKGLAKLEAHLTGVVAAKNRQNSSKCSIPEPGTEDSSSFLNDFSLLSPDTSSFGSLVSTGSYSNSVWNGTGSFKRSDLVPKPSNFTHRLIAQRHQFEVWREPELSTSRSGGDDEDEDNSSSMSRHDSLSNLRSFQRGPFDQSPLNCDDLDPTGDFELSACTESDLGANSLAQSLPPSTAPQMENGLCDSFEKLSLFPSTQVLHEEARSEVLGTASSPILSRRASPTKRRLSSPTTKVFNIDSDRIRSLEISSDRNPFSPCTAASLTNAPRDGREGSPSKVLVTKARAEPSSLLSCDHRSSVVRTSPSVTDESPFKERLPSQLDAHGEAEDSHCSTACILEPTASKNLGDLLSQPSLGLKKSLKPGDFCSTRSMLSITGLVSGLLAWSKTKLSKTGQNRAIPIIETEPPPDPLGEDSEEGGAESYFTPPRSPIALSLPRLRPLREVAPGSDPHRSPKIFSYDKGDHVNAASGGGPRFLASTPIAAKPGGDAGGVDHVVDDKFQIIESSPHYIAGGSGPTKVDFDVHASLYHGDVDVRPYPHLALWYESITALSESRSGGRRRQWISSVNPNNIGAPFSTCR